MERTDWLDEGLDSADARFLMLTAITHHQFSSPIWGEHEVRKLHAELAELDVLATWAVVDQSVSRSEGRRASIRSLAHGEHGPGAPYIRAQARERAYPAAMTFGMLSNSALRGAFMPPDRWFAVGTADVSADGAGGRAADAALIHDEAKLLIVFCSPTENVPDLIGQIRSRSGDVPLIGCTTAGEIARNGPRDGSVVVAALGGDGFVIGTAAAAGASEDLRDAGARAARCLPSPAGHPHRVMLLLTDGLASDQDEIIRGAYSVLGAGIPMVGGCAGDGLKMTRTFQFHGDHVLTDSVIAAGIASTGPLGIGVQHGWRAVGEPMLVTGSSPNRVDSLDDRPALDVFLERLGTEPGHLRPEDLPALALMHPLGLGRHRGEEQMRFITSADFMRRSLFSTAQVPQGSLAFLMEADTSAVLAATTAACDASIAALGGSIPLGMLAFDCVARRGVLGHEGIKKEIQGLADAAGGAPLAGFYSYGEIARTHGMRGLHNYTLVILSVA